MDADKIFDTFPNAQMVYMVRNPFSSYADTVKRPFALGLERYIQGWNTIQHAALIYAQKYKGRFQMARSVTFFASEFEQKHNIPWVQADMICLKPPYSDNAPGAQDI